MITMAAQECDELAKVIRRHGAVYAECEAHEPGIFSDWRMVYPDFNPKGDLVRIGWDGGSEIVERAS
jgi:hypothetical protein